MNRYSGGTYDTATGAARSPSFYDPPCPICRRVPVWCDCPTCEVCWITGNPRCVGVHMHWWHWPARRRQLWRNLLDAWPWALSWSLGMAAGLLFAKAGRQATTFAQRVLYETGTSLLGFLGLLALVGVLYAVHRLWRGP